MNATNKEGHIWQGAKSIEAGTTWFLYEDEKGNLYESKEKPAYRIVMDNAHMTDKGIAPLTVQ